MPSWRTVEVSNGRVAWIVAAVAVGAILALPLPALAQRDEPFQRPSNGSASQRGAPGNAIGSSPQSSQGARRGNFIDIIDMLDATANMMMVETPSAPGAEPLRPQEIVCLAGCDTSPGSVVYREVPKPTLASLSAPITPAAPRGTVAATPEVRAAPAQPLSCVAGCYEPRPVVTVASLRAAQQVARTERAPPRRSGAAPAAGAPPVVANLAPEGRVTSQAAATPAPSARLLAGVIPSRHLVQAKRRPATARANAAPSAHRVRLGQTRYGKVLPVAAAQHERSGAVATAGKSPSPATAQPAASAPPAAAPAKTNEHASPPVSTFTPSRKPERKPTAKARPVATVSTDWFNKLKREQQDAAKTAAP